MIARHEAPTREQDDIWSRLAAPLPNGTVEWRQDGKPAAREGKYFARFVCYVEANTVRERLDSVVPGEWDLTLELLPPLVTSDGEELTACSFKARLQVLGVIREDVGTGRDYKAAATDAFKRAAVRFGIAHELYSYDMNWVEVDSDSKYAKALEEPSVAYARSQARKSGATEGEQRPRPTMDDGAPALPSTRRSALRSGTTAAPTSVSTTTTRASASATTSPTTTNDDDESPSCPKCGGRMWDNRLTKRNPKAPDFKCRDRACDGVVWPPKPKKTALPTGADDDSYPTPMPDDTDIPF